MTVIQAKIFRYDPETDEPPKFETFRIEYTQRITVLDALKEIYQNQAPDLGFMYGCRTNECGTCAVRVNKRAVLACKERVEGDIVVEPLVTPFSKIIRDLIIDRSGIDNRLRAAEYFVQRVVPHQGKPDSIDPDIIEEIRLLGRCIDCLICMDRCPAHQRRDFYGPMFMIQLQKLLKHPFDTGERISKSHQMGLWNCIQCQQCTESCPQDIDPARSIREMRSIAFRTMMGKGVKL